MAQSALREQILVNAAELMCKLNPDKQHRISEHRLIVRRCGMGESKGYKGVIIDYAVIRIEGPRANTFLEALESLLNFTAEALKPHLEGYENMKFSHIKGQALKRREGSRIAVKAPTEQTATAASPAKKVRIVTKKLESPAKKLESPMKKVEVAIKKLESPPGKLESF
ncbi:hypothetical protein LTR78_007571 [Recurvomyces mirabilis]|uniref:Uncharacterized protein n=1 Tax=Recurvomyces mirabilis TaxID=574656 RepID=A0AAE0TVC3_9PEZI|nr:hypothetical protein LTR78_007571 [Recurvomyces mirabilis]KAK5159917.1 hypothetical protein LTS14_002023 [Recurvomyces mirabilis]